MAEATKFTGKGTFKFPEGTYTGEFVDGIRQGYGILKFSNYDIYDGDWESGKMQGRGTYKFYDQDLDFGNMRLMIRKNGQSQIYIDFSNISWAYDVIRTN